MTKPDDRVRFQLDEHMDPDIAGALRAYGVDIVTTHDQSLASADDETHLERARAEQRVVVTDDVDFLRLASTLSDHAGIVFCRRTKHSLGEIIEFLLLIHGASSAAEMRGRVEYL